MPRVPTSLPSGDAGTPPHLIVPFAVCSSDAWLKTVTAMDPGSTRHTQALLRGMTRVAGDLGSEHSLSPPHERALAQALGLPITDELDGLIPWAAWEAARSGFDARPEQDGGWAWVTPCHWAMGREHATLSDPAALGLSELESRTLLAAMAPYFETDDIRLHFLRADRWLAEGDVFRSLPTASLDRVLGRDVDPWLPKSKTLARLQNEMQMLLYTHAINDARAAARLLPVNSFWVSGSGALPDAPPSPLSHILTPSALADAAFQNDWVGYAKAWAALDAGLVKELSTHQREGRTVRLTLCGERSFETWESSPRSWHRPLSDWLQSLSVFSPQPLLIGRKQL